MPNMEIGTAKGARMVSLIHTNLLTRGEGIEGDPIRGVSQFFTPEGRLVAEVDGFDTESWFIDRLCAKLGIDDFESPKHARELIFSTLDGLLSKGGK